MQGLSGEQMDGLYLLFVAGFCVGLGVSEDEISDYYDDVLDDEERAAIYKRFRAWLGSEEGRGAAKLIGTGKYS